MGTYIVRPVTKGSSWKIHGWKVQKSGWFGGSTLKVFSERQQAMEYVKYVADQHRPSQVKTYDNKGNMVFSWSYSARPRIKK